MARMTATEAARGFSEVLTRVAAGEEIEVTRGGAPVALVTPPRAHLMSGERFLELLASAPSPDDAFGPDVMAARKALGSPRDPWPS